MCGLLVTNNSEFKTSSSRGFHTWYWEPIHIPRASETLYLEGEATTSPLLNQYNQICVLILTDKCIPYPSSMKFLFELSRDHYKNHNQLKLRLVKTNLKD